MKTNNRTIGIIGGMGPQASAKLLEVLIDMASKKYGAKNDFDFPEIILNSIPVPNFISNKNSLDKALSILKSSIAKLEIFNPTCFGIACNTAHILLDKLQETTDVPFVSIIESVSTSVQAQNLKKIGLLATPVTINSELYQKALSKYNIEVIIPNARELKDIEIVIKNVLSGNVLTAERMRVVSIACSLKSRGAQGIILGCTELPLIFPETFSVPVFNSINILASTLLEKLYSAET